MPSIWYTHVVDGARTALRTPQDWAGVVSSGVAQVDISTVLDVEGTTNDRVAVWARQGVAVSAARVTAAIATGSPLPLPPQHVPTPSPGSSGEARIKAVEDGLAALTTVARTGKYADLTGKPTIPPAPDLSGYLSRQDATATYGPFFRGKAGRSYAFVAGVIRNYNDGAGWKLLTDGFHPPIGITAVDSLTDTGLIRIDYPGLKPDGSNAGRTVTLVAQPDETLAKAGFTVGCSVEPNVARLQLQQTRSLNDYVYYDTTAGAYKLWKNEFWAAGRSPFTVTSATNNHLILSHAQAIQDDRFDFGVDRVGGPGENYLPTVSTSQQPTILTQITLNFWTDPTTAANSSRVTAPDGKCRAFVRRGMSRAYVPPADVNTTTYPGGNIWLLGIMQDQAAS